MKKLLAIILATLVILTLVAGCTKAEKIPVYSWEEAFDHTNETATVTGPVVEEEHPTLGNTSGGLLYLGKPAGYGFLIQMAVDFEENQYVGHTISVTGFIAPAGWPSGGARIYVEDLSQIEIID